MRVLTLAFIGAVSLNLAAAPLTPEQALRRAADENAVCRIAGLNSALTPRLLYTVDSPEYGLPGCYVFSYAGGDDGFIVLSADDVAVPVLGYGDSAFDLQNMPPGLAFMLDLYADEIGRASKSTLSMPKFVKGRPDREPIAPLLTTKWDQDAPYNLMCPTLDGEHCYTGCVATAMAQVANYYEWPKTHGVGVKTYKWRGKELSFDFGTTAFDWDNMHDTYMSAGSSLDNPADRAVATLMYAVGVASEMEYGLDSSGAYDFYAFEGMKKYMDYSKNAYMARRNNYGIVDWENLVYDNLVNCGPVYYSGTVLANDGSMESGHAFVCDGYGDEGFFHINWGWSGMSDGYFLLSALDPDSQGIGGSAYGYNYDQYCAINLVPAGADESQPYHGMFMYDNFCIDPERAALGSEVHYDLYAINCSSETLTSFVPGVRIEDADGSSVVALSAYEFSDMGINYSVAFDDLPVILPVGLADGIYTVYPGFEDAEGVWYDFRFEPGLTKYAYMEVSSTEVAFAYPSALLPDCTIGSVGLHIVDGVPFDCNIIITNTADDEFYDKVLFVLFNQEDYSVVATGGYSLIDLLPGESRDYTVTVTFDDVPVGNYGMLVATESDLYYMPISPAVEVEVVDMPEGDLTVKFGNLDVTTSVTDDTVGSVNVRLETECTSGAGEIYLCVSVLDSYFDELSADYSVVRIMEGQTKQFDKTFTVNDVNLGETYYIFYGCYDADGNWIDYDYYPFEFGLSGIDSLTEDVDVELYDLMGRRVQDSTRGIIIRVKTGPDGSRSVDRIVK